MYFWETICSDSRCYSGTFQKQFFFCIRHPHSSLWVSYNPHGMQGPEVPQIFPLDYSLLVGNPQHIPCPCSVPGRTVWEIGVTELQIFAGASWVMLSAQWMLHLLNFQFQGIQWAKNFLHAICIVHVVVSVSIIHQLAGIDVSPGPLGGLDGQWLDDFSRRTLSWGERRQLLIGNGEETEEMAKAATSTDKQHHKTGKTPTMVLMKTPATRHEHKFHLFLTSSHY